MKEDRKTALRARLEAAQRDIYGNARVREYANDIDGFREFFDWLGDYARRESDYMRGERFGLTLRETCAPRWIPARERLESARRKIPNPRWDTEVRAEARNYFADHFAGGLYRTLIREGVGECYAYGRNGKTFYPEAYAHENGTGFHLRDVAEDLNAEALTDAVLWLEQFNDYVRSVAKGAASAYRDEAAERLREDADEQRDAIREDRASYAELAAEMRALRFVDGAPTACGVLRQRLENLRRSVRNAAQELRTINATLRTLEAQP